MTPEAFEQAKRDHLEKWGYTISVNKKGELYNANCKRGLNKDLTALLEQHKEMILADMYPKKFLEWMGEELGEDRISYTVTNWRRPWFYNHRHLSLEELFNYWLKT